MRKLFLIILLVPFFALSQNKISKGFSYLALGDSYTIGESVKESNRWPVQLYESLNGKLSYPKIIAKSGWTTDELLDTLNKTKIKKYDFVSLLIGVNNQYRGKSLKKFKKDFNELLNRSITYSGGKNERVFVVSIPDWGVTPFADNKNRNIIEREINKFNKVIFKECLKNDIKFFNVTEISRKALFDISLIAKDGLHPSKKMYKQWVEIIKPHFKNF